MFYHRPKWFRKWKGQRRKNGGNTVQQKEDKYNSSPLILSGTQIEWRTEVKYLGVIMDENITFSNHIKETKKKTTQLKGRIYPLIGRKSKTSIENKIRVAKTIIIPTITYGGGV